MNTASHYPILILVVRSKEFMVIDTPEEIPQHTGFKVIGVQVDKTRDERRNARVM